MIWFYNIYISYIIVYKHLSFIHFFISPKNKRKIPPIKFYGEKMSVLTTNQKY